MSRRNYYGNPYGRTLQKRLRSKKGHQKAPSLVRPKMKSQSPPQWAKDLPDNDVSWQIDHGAAIAAIDPISSSPMPQSQWVDPLGGTFEPTMEQRQEKVYSFLLEHGEKTFQSDGNIRYQYGTRNEIDMVIDADGRMLQSGWSGAIDPLIDKSINRIGMHPLTQSTVNKALNDSRAQGVEEMFEFLVEGILNMPAQLEADPSRIPSMKEQLQRDGAEFLSPSEVAGMSPEQFTRLNEAILSTAPKLSQLLDVPVGAVLPSWVDTGAKLALPPTIDPIATHALSELGRKAVGAKDKALKLQKEHDLKKLGIAAGIGAVAGKLLMDQPLLGAIAAPAVIYLLDMEKL